MKRGSENLLGGLQCVDNLGKPVKDGHDWMLLSFTNTYATFSTTTDEKAWIGQQSYQFFVYEEVPVDIAPVTAAHPILIWFECESSHFYPFSGDWPP